MAGCFGTATGRFDNTGRMIGFHDRFDLDSKPWGARSKPAEIATRLGRYTSSIMTLGGNAPYEVSYPCE